MGVVVETAIHLEPAVILCGGRGSRIGGDKGFRALAGRPLLAHVIDRLGPQVGLLAINAPAGDPRFARFGLPVIPDRAAGYPGPLAGIAAALAWARDLGEKHVIVAPVDTPFLPVDFVSRLAAATGAAVSVARTGDRVHPVAGRFSVDLLEDAEAELVGDQRRSMMAWLERHDARHTVFEPVRLGANDIDPLLNVNTPDDLARAERLLAGSTTGIA